MTKDQAPGPDETDKESAEFWDEVFGHGVRNDASGPEGPASDHESFSDFMSRFDPVNPADSIETGVGLIASAIVAYAAKKFGVDPELIMAGAISVASVAAVSYRAATNYRHYKKTGEKRPFLKPNERELLRRAGLAVATMLHNIGVRFNRERLIKIAKALVVAINTAFGVASPTLVHAAPIVSVEPRPVAKITITGTMGKPVWAVYTNGPTKIDGAAPKSKNTPWRSFSMSGAGTVTLRDGETDRKN